MTDLYLDDAAYADMRAKLVELFAHPPLSGIIDIEYRITEILGEVGGIWPASIEGEAIERNAA